MCAIADPKLLILFTWKSGEFQSGAYLLYFPSKRTCLWIGAAVLFDLVVKITIQVTSLCVGDSDLVIATVWAFVLGLSDHGHDLLAPRRRHA